MDDRFQPSRRLFLQAGAAAGGGLMLGIGFGAQALTVIPDAPLGLYVIVPSSGRIRLVSKNPEIGQGIKTMMPMLIAEELDVTWDQVDIVQGEGAVKYEPQFAGGSMATPMNWLPMRQAGAAARLMLVTAAANRWGVKPEDCTVKAGVISNSGRTLSYTEVATEASRLPVPDPATLKLKDAKDFAIIGRTHKGYDSPRIVRGEPIFGIDARVNGMVHAVFVRPPAFGAKLVSADIEAARAMKGVKDVFVLKAADYGDDWMHGLKDGVAILASNTWYARQAREALKVEWDLSGAAGHTTELYATRAAELMNGAPVKVTTDQGKADEAFAAAKTKVTADYAAPFLPHVNMEPQNCTVHVQKDKVEIWAPTQLPGAGRDLVAKALGVAPESLVIHMERCGGGFGRRLENDYMVEAAVIAKKAGVPVKLTWTREDDIANDYFRSGANLRMEGGLDETGRITAFRQHAVTYSRGGEVAQGANVDARGFAAIVAPNVRMGESYIETPVTTGYLRAPASNLLAYVSEAFVDELAHAAGQDPVAFRLAQIEAHLAAHPVTEAGNPWNYNPERMRDVIRIVAERSGWGRKMPEGVGLGIGCYFSHQGHFAEVAQVKVADGFFHVQKVWVVGDIGSTIINPTHAINQVEGSVIDGIGEMSGEITFVDGAVQQSNFHDFPMIRMPQAPQIDVHFHITGFSPTGVGEPALPPVVPAVANAIFAACGKRVRSLPIRPGSLA
ncbi:aldehyde oxidase [Asticcacaulis sp. AC460]|uniref:xanthine dehydrogenase family protein molybdopterin-binding subunit n=1 Tax=Asticcacaulis sp. AC460 TaxID=1282360 RepID=UPI0003C3B5D8|nr:molybdopterin cofactor-binding domain-containing protein [Asticcacaulis sp. AC460]ESQ92914.1 aldehyde oxidase [Asticcacaulis sp. AC460]